MKRIEVLALAVAAALSGTGCGGAAADHETLGDEAYVERRYDEALAEFQLALRQGSSGEDLRGKAAMAALNARELGEAASQFQALAGENPGRLMIAADGLERVARAAMLEGNGAALQAALDAMRAVAPGRALGAFAREVAVGWGENSSPAEAISVLPYAAASASDARLQDSLMYAYSVALARLNRCEEGIPVFESLLRRRRAPSIQSDARVRVASCTLGLGRREHNRGSPDAAEAWFCRTIELGNNNYAARAAYLGLGDVWFSRGDFMGAREAFLKAMA
ncbi:MAG: hypothetical protein V3W06_09330, partial [Acidimicrobiia bacterium]